MIREKARKQIAELIGANSGRGLGRPKRSTKRGDWAKNR